ncbi:MAG: GDP-mannose 4,6-dehydratase [Thermomicrobiales bacterium]|nr:GDP-mannose 4,6-dehydratase [Thermomicrobiales bacterium]
MTKRALITGITGQDGSYLAELLLAKGYEVHGLVRRTSFSSTGRIDHLLSPGAVGRAAVTLHQGDLSDPFNLNRLVNRVRPDEVYNLGAQSHVGVSFETPAPTADVTGLGALRMLEALRNADWPVRFYQAGSSEMFGAVRESPQRETTPFAPRSPYAVAKVFAHHMTVLYREAYGLFACNGIMFNHESPRRGTTFVTRKVTRGVACIVAGKIDAIVLGNLDARRDWGYAPEYVEAMWRMLQQSTPGDYAIATGETRSVRDLVEVAFALVGRDWRDCVTVDPTLYRPAEVDVLVGDAGRAARELGWRPRTTFRDLVRIMLAADLRAAGVDPARFPALAVESPVI